MVTVYTSLTQLSLITRNYLILLPSRRGALLSVVIDMQWYQAINFLGLWISTYSKNDQPDINKKQTVN